MNKIKRYIYVAIGLIAFLLGAVGVILPILPTTPFLLLASFCFIRGSEKFNLWFVNTKIYKKHLEGFIKEKSMTLKQKVCILGGVYFMLSIPLILVSNLHARLLIVFVMGVKLYYFTFKIKTKKI